MSSSVDGLRKEVAMRWVRPYATDAPRGFITPDQQFRDLWAEREEARQIAKALYALAVARTRNPADWTVAERYALADVPGSIRALMNKDIAKRDTDA